MLPVNHAHGSTTILSKANFIAAILQKKTVSGIFLTNVKSENLFNLRFSISKTGSQFPSQGLFYKVSLKHRLNLTFFQKFCRMTNSQSADWHSPFR